MDILCTNLHYHQAQKWGFVLVDHVQTVLVLQSIMMLVSSRQHKIVAPFLPFKYTVI